MTDKAMLNDLHELQDKWFIRFKSSHELFDSQLMSDVCRNQNSETNTRYFCIYFCVIDCIYFHVVFKLCQLLNLLRNDYFFWNTVIHLLI